MVSTDVLKKIHLIKGVFSPAEASQIIGSLIQEKINFHKCQQLQEWLVSRDCETHRLEGRIKELTEERAYLLSIIDEADKAGFYLEVKGDIEFSFTKPQDDYRHV